MTQFSNAPILSGKRPDGAFLSGTQLENAITTDSLQVFNVPSVGAINQGNGLSELRQAFGLLGNVVQGAGQITAEARAKQEVFDRGEAASRSSLDNIDVARSFDENPDSIPDGVKASEYATSLVEAQINTQYADKSEAWKNAYRENSAPKLANLVRSHLDQRQNVKTAEALTGFSELAYNGNIDEALKGARALPGITEQQVYAGVILPGLKTASATGNQEAFDRLAAALPEGQFKQTVDLERAQLQGAMMQKNARDQQQAMAFFEEIANTQSPEVAADALRRMRDSGELTATNAAKAQELLDDRQKASAQQAVAAATNSLVSAVRSNAITAKQGLSAIDQWEATVGVKAANGMREAFNSALANKLHEEDKQAVELAKSSLLTEQRAAFANGSPVATLPDLERVVNGKTVKVSGDDAAKIIMSEEFQKIDQSSRTPAEAASRKVQLSAEKGYEPEEWKGLLSLPYVGAGSVEKMDAVPPAWEEALTLYTIMRRTEPGLATKMVGDQERAFYDAVLSNMQSTTTGGRPNVLAAFKQAQAARMRPPEEVASMVRNIPDKNVESAALSVVNNSTWFSFIRGESKSSAARNIGNLNELQTAIKSEAVRLVKAGEPSPDAAVEKAKQTVMASGSVINGFWTLTNVDGLPKFVQESLPQLGQKIIDDYKATTKEDGKYGLAYDRRYGSWRVVDFLGMPVDGPKDKTTFRNGDLVRMWQADRNAEAEARRIAAVEKNARVQADNKMRNDFPTPPGMLMYTR